MNIGFPYHFDNNGRTAESSDDRHIKDLISQVLFTSPGERVNRPEFGCGLMKLVYESNSDELAVTTQFLVQSALQQWLSDLIEVNDVSIEHEDSKLKVTVNYTVRRTQELQAADFYR